ncbi:MAG TPA: heparinase II/III family protein [Tepidisphaeraceae bacterium]|jgi:hypothetical protein|nr:heparinase II/III family protein [Tepidisphaeraceae bacterium]
MKTGIFSGVVVLVSSIFVYMPAVGAADVLKPRAEHPYLYFTPDRIAQLKDRVQKEKSVGDNWQKMLASADQVLDRPNANVGELELLGLAYRMTGDKKFADKMRDIMLRECTLPNWGEADLLARDPAWHAGLGTARIVYSMAVGFDCAYDALSAEDRKTIAKGLVDLGVLTTLNDWLIGPNRIHSLDTMGHNWWSACVFMAGVGAMAVMDDDPRASEWLQRISEGSVEFANYSGSILETKPKTFDDAGGFWESANYASFGVSEFLLFRLAWQNALEAKPPQIPVLDKIGDFFLNICYPNSGRLMSVEFGDGALNVDGSRPVLLSWSLGDHKPRNLWYLNQTGQEVYREGLDRRTPMGIVYYPSEEEMTKAPASPDLPPSMLYKQMGWAMLRSSWNKDATLLAVKSGFTWNHSHADEGSFILFHHGEYLLIDSGNCNYSQPEYDAYYRQSQAHNVILFDGEGENPEDTYHGSQFPGSLSNLIDAGDLRYVWADATGPVSKNFIRNFRHFLWIGNVILIIDDLKTYRAGQFEWLLHYGGEAKMQGIDLRVSQGDANVSVRPLFPETFPTGLPHDFPDNMKLVKKVGLKDHDEKTKVTYYAFTPPEQSRQTTFITAVVLGNDSGKPPVLEKITGKNMIGVRIHENGKTTNVYVNLLAEGRIRHIDADLQPEGWDTDAYLSGITFPDGADTNDPDAASRYFISDGSYLRRGDKIVLDSLSKVFATWKHDGGKLDIQLQGQPDINAHIRTAGKPAEINLNNQSAPVNFDEKASAVTVHPSN